MVDTPVQATRISGAALTPANRQSFSEHLVALIPRQARESNHSKIAETALLLLGVGVTIAWAVIAHWHSLEANRNNVHFAFEKVPGHSDSPVLRGTLLLFLALAAAYFGGYFLLRRQQRLTRRGKLATLLLVIGPALANVVIYPVGALDVFNYMIELKLAFHFGENPYLVTFANYRSDPFALPAFLVDVPLFYGPAWLLSSGVPAFIGGFSDLIRLLLTLKLFNLVLLGLTALLIARGQRRTDRSWLAAYLFAANPLVLFETVGNGHNDVLMTVFLIAALVCLRAPSAAAGPLLALSVLVKFFSGAVAPVFAAVSLRDRWGWRQIALAGLLATTTVVATVAPFWADGAMINGFIRGTETSQEMDHVSILSLALQTAGSPRPIPAWSQPLFALSRPCWATFGSGDNSSSTRPASHCRPGWLPARKRANIIRRTAAAIFAIAAVMIAAAVWRGRAAEAAAIDLLLLFSLLMTNLYPWYLVPIIAIIALRTDKPGLRYLFLATALGLAYYPAYVFARFDAGWQPLQMHLFLAIFLTVPMVVFLIVEFGAFVHSAWPIRHPIPQAPAVAPAD